MNRTTKVIGFSVPPAIARQVERMAKKERRTKSELFREMVRVYEDHTRKKVAQERVEFDDAWVERVIAEAKAEEAAHPMTEDEIRAEELKLARYGAAQAKKLGIKPKDVNRLIHEYRQERKAARSSRH